MARIGMVGFFFHRGHSVVNLTLHRALTELGHELFVFARQGSVYGQPMRETTGVFDLPNRYDHPTYEILPNVLRGWAQYNKLSACVFSEEYDFTLPMNLKASGVKTIHYLDFLGKTWRPFLRHYDLLLTATHRTESILQGWNKLDQTQFIGWGVPQQACAFPRGEAPPYMPPGAAFFHNAGFLGLNMRKGTDTLLQAMQHFSMENEPPDCYVHCQLPMDMAKQVMRWHDSLPPYVIWDDRTIPPPGLYAQGRVVVQPSKLEGLGLTIVEAMAAGRPVITVDSPPMNEFVSTDTGWLVPVQKYQKRSDGILFEEAIIDPQMLWKTMAEARALSDDAIAEKARLTLERAREIFAWDAFKNRLQEGLAKIEVYS